MSILIRNRKIEEADYIVVPDDTPMPAEGKFIVSMKRWQNESSTLHAGNCSFGVNLPNNCNLAEVWPELKSLQLIALEFPTFGDGRAYSQARVLRDRFNFQGEIRAIGAAVVQDQLYGMLRCGVNSFLLRCDQDALGCLEALKGFSAAYQMAADDLHPILIQRRS